MLNIYRRPMLCALLVCGACSSAPRAPAADAGGGGGPVPTPLPGAQFGGLGVVGDSIFFVDHYVRADARQTFEDFVRDVLWPAFQRSGAPGVSAPGEYLLQRIRFLKPQAANEDGSYTYTFILDPLVPGVSYNVLEFLRNAYGEAEALKHYATWTGTWSSDFTVRRFVQTR
jgi:hypothetical protein